MTDADDYGPVVRLPHLSRSELDVMLAALLDRQVFLQLQGAKAGRAVPGQAIVHSLITAVQEALIEIDREERRIRFVLSRDAAEAWDALTDRPARELPGLRRLMEPPSDPNTQ